MKLDIIEEDRDCIGVYAITNNLNNKIYIGSTTNSFYKRWQAYKNFYEQGINKKFRNSIKKYGLNNFTFSIVEVVNIDVVREREEYYIKKLDTVKSGYNIKYGGVGGNGGANLGKKYPKPSKEVVRRRARNISKAREGMKFTEEHCKAISAAKKGKPSKRANSIRVKNIETGEVFNYSSCSEAAKKIGCSLQQVCSLNKRKSKRLKKVFVLV